ncbi:hypothetical protein SAMN05216188_112197 [Lentzea xinjiangensis]|uniref:Uncharacterized protein n=1 Tax=Lentzea xinjiangensis TaxID=402600 RepID=A0A1H9Q2X8_9PSEU|nr:hypothetical protein [Lentzea xinjiangensis]SER54732.1 hypothetical protein SAMN05216188_112197 [Lentzea xinjiangensis]
MTDAGARRQGFGSGAAELGEEDDGGAVADDSEDEVVGDGSVHDAGGLLCVSVGSAGFVVTLGCSGAPGRGCAWDCAACLRSGVAEDFGAADDTVTTTVLVLPSGATLVIVWTTSADARSGAASSPEAASMDATVANRVATTTPPAASMTAVPMRFF